MGPFDTVGENSEEGTKLIKVLWNTDLEFFALWYKKCWVSSNV